MRLSGIHHVSILVTDIPRAIAFYRDALGLRQIERPPTFTAPELRGVIWFELGTQQLHLLPAPAADVPARRHFALHLDDAIGARAELLGRGVAIKETTPIPGADRFFVNDPDGNRIELIQWHEMPPVKYV